MAWGNIGLLRKNITSQGIKRTIFILKKVTGEENNRDNKGKLDKK